MPTIITRGLGYDTPTIVVRDIGDRFNATLVVEDRLRGYLEVVEEDVPVATIRDAIPVQGTLVLEDWMQATLTTVDTYVGYLYEEGCAPMEDVRIQMYLRDDRTLSLTINDSDDDPVDLTDAKLYFTVKTKMSDPDTSAIFQKKNAAAGGGDTEIKVTDATGGAAEIYVVPADTEDVNPGNYMWDVQVILANGKTYTVLRGRVTFKEDVTKETG